MIIVYVVLSVFTPGFRCILKSPEFLLNFGQCAILSDTSISRTFKWSEYIL